MSTDFKKDLPQWRPPGAFAHVTYLLNPDGSRTKLIPDWKDQTNKTKTEGKR